MIIQTVLLSSEQVMKTGSKWHDTIEREIDSLKGELSIDEYIRYRVDLLRRIIKVISDLSPKCERCRDVQENMAELIKEIRCISNMSKKIQSDYFRSLEEAVQHFHQSHRRVSLE